MLQDLYPHIYHNEMAWKAPAPDDYALIFAPDGTEIEEGAESPLLWTAETPNLYGLLLSFNGEYIYKRFGFREISVAENCALLINGEPVKLKGVNHHDTHPKNGYTVTKEELWEELCLICLLYTSPSPRDS